MTIPKAGMRIKFIRDVLKGDTLWKKGLIVDLYVPEFFKLDEIAVRKPNERAGWAFFNGWSDKNKPNFIEGLDFVFVSQYKRKDIY